LVTIRESRTAAIARNIARTGRGANAQCVLECRVYTLIN
jgi:hypothetical protein